MSSMNFYIPKEQHPEYENRITDKEQVVVGGTYRCFHCLPEREWTEWFSSTPRILPAMYFELDVVVTAVHDEYFESGPWQQKHFFSDRGVVPYETGLFNQSNFMTLLTWNLPE